MSLKYSSAVLAAIFSIATPALAQDTAAPATEQNAEQATGQVVVPNSLPESMDAAAEDAAKSVSESATKSMEQGTSNAGTDSAADTSKTTDEAAAGSETTPSDTASTTDAAAGTDTAAPEAAAGNTATSDTNTATGSGTDSAVADNGAAGTAAASGEPQVGAYYEKSTHADWMLRCVKVEKGADPCEMYQLLKDATGNSVAEVTMIPLGGDKVALGATVVAPLETDLTYGLHMQVDTGREGVYPFNFCAPVGCVSRLGFTPAELTALKRGNAATMKLLPFGGDPEKPVSVTMSLAGFTAAYDDLEKVVAEARSANAEASQSTPESAEAAPAN